MSRILSLLLSIVVVAAASWAVAESNRSDVSPAPAKSGKNKELPSFTQEREAAALTFVRTHHPELADLLAQLKKHNRPQYQQAIRELFRSSERLAQQQEKSPKKYESELALWKLNSRIQVLVAQLTMGPNPAIEEQLRQAITEQLALRRSELQAEKDRITGRLAELDKELVPDDATRVEQRLQALLKSAAEKTNNASKSSPKGS